MGWFEELIEKNKKKGYLNNRDMEKLEEELNDREIRIYDHEMKWKKVNKSDYLCDGPLL